VLKTSSSICLGFITACGLTGLALLAGNVNKSRNFYQSPNFELANSGQVRVETVVIEQIYFKLLLFFYPLLQNSSFIHQGH